MVSMDWVHASRVAGFWAEESSYTACDFHFNTGENVVELSLQRYRERAPPLFSGLRFYIHGTKLGAFERADLCRMIEVGGGVCISALAPSSDGALFVICDPSIPQSEAESLWSMSGRDPVFYVWLFDCVSSLALRSTRHSHLYKKTFFEDTEAVRFSTQNSPAAL